MGLVTGLLCRLGVCPPQSHGWKPTPARGEGVRSPLGGEEVVGWSCRKGPQRLLRPSGHVRTQREVAPVNGERPHWTQTLWEPGSWPSSPPSPHRLGLWARQRSSATPEQTRAGSNQPFLSPGFSLWGPLGSVLSGGGQNNPALYQMPDRPGRLLPS